MTNTTVERYLWQQTPDGEYQQSQRVKTLTEDS